MLGGGDVGEAPVAVVSVEFAGVVLAVEDFVVVEKQVDVDVDIAVVIVVDVAERGAAGVVVHPAEERRALIGERLSRRGVGCRVRASNKPAVCAVVRGAAWGIVDLS